MADWFVYMIRCGDGSLYTGVSTDVARRFAEHASGGPKSARYLRGRGPLTLLHVMPARDRSHALSLEYRIKRLPRERKLELIDGLRHLS